MSFNTYNNNDKQPTNTTYSSISFSNPEALEGSRINISYFNKLLQITIAKKNGMKNNFATYDNENGSVIYVSVTKAKILYDLLQIFKEDESMHNVCIETNKGLLMISDGSDLGVTSPCISITTSDNSGNVKTVAYQTKANYHKGAYNYDMNAGSFSDKFFDELELETFENVLLQYINAGTYAVAATVMEAGMYKRNALRDTVNQIAEKVGVQTGNKNGGGYSNKSSFLNNNSGNNSNGSSSNSGGMNGVPKEYESASFDDIAHGMGQ